MSFNTFKIPLKPGNLGNFELTGNYDEALKQRVQVLLSTEPGSRIMELDYGASLRKFLFEPNDNVLSFKVKTYLTEKFKKYIPEFKIKNVETKIDEANENVLYVNILFEYKNKEETILVKV